MAQTVSDSLRGQRAALLSEMERILDTCKKFNRAFSPAEEQRCDDLQKQIAEMDDRIIAAKDAEVRRVAADAAAGDASSRSVERVGGFTVTSEARTYSKHSSESSDEREGRSYFVDMMAYSQGDLSARERIERHAREVEVDGNLSKRATSTTSFAGLVVPQYLVEEAALIARAARPFANTVRKMQIPDAGMSFLVPRGTTGASAAVQATENSSVSSTDEVWGNVTVPVVTIAGQQDVSRQSLERGSPGLDSLIYADLAGAYGVALDQQVLSGSGSSGQMLGVFNTAGVNQATAFTAAATAATFYTKIAGQISAITSTRFLAPTWIAMAPRRGAWLESLTDTTGRPLVVPGAQAPMNVMGLDPATDYGTGGSLLGLNVVTDANLPTAVGTGPEDQVLVYRAQDLILWEDGDGMPQQLRFEQTLGNQLTVKLVAYGYAAFTAGRYPASVGIIGGNAGSAGFGLVAPTF